ncbi:imelysin family protein [Colwellia sp. 1_MG-2023]|uniref:imelysin family protein n=1 Tax=unclassified Colwellia TaxID=196834 RepID=UPI001C0869CE|nr:MULTISPECIES: imelysin family protein [unclassified Colwellia]MBU2923939.1 iron-regulated protein A precursor [Colwellia sp. C2M11]MDO6653407.1 imelysin family protein [Colwellia sp. 3_MG-2023]MDO6666191.1 imelysin family protein [Colwellia sp. 2_MG-2023]MDO6690564.1 imelysin family protein [Colwellia sp. 1_MG-2023]
MIFKKSLLAAAISALVLTACGGSSSDSEPPVVEETSFSFEATEMITNLTNDVIVAGYQNLNDGATDFLLATQNLVNTPTEENLALAQQAWKEVRVPWEQGESHIFGPVDALSIDPHLDTWPLNTSDLEALLASQASFSADELKTFNDDVQGFHTMEFLLFGDGVEDNEKSIDEMTTLESEYLSAAAEVFKTYTQSLLDAWIVANDPNDANSPAYKDLLLTTNNDIYASQLGVVEELINGMIGIVDEVGNGKIAEPFGSNIDNIDTSKVESQYSWNSLADFTDNIRGVQNVYRGEFSGQADKAGIIDFVNAADADLATRVDTEITDAIAAIEAIAGDNDLPFRQAINDADARVRIQAAIDALSTLQTSFENDVLTKLQDWQQ